MTKGLVNLSLDLANQFKKQYKRIEKQKERVCQNALVKGLRSEVANPSKRRFKTLLPNASRHNPRYEDTLIQGIRVKKLKKSSKAMATITSMYWKKRSQSFKIKFFEDGTKMRRTRKGGHNRGYIKALHFFNGSIGAVDERRYTKIVADEIEKNLIKKNLK